MEVAFLFDNDGVLIDSSEMHWQSWTLLMQQMPELKMDRESFTGSFGKRNDLILKDLMPQMSDAQRKQVAEDKERLFRECAKGKLSLLPGMENFLESVLERQIPHIIASSTPVDNLQMFLKTTILGHFFDTFVSAEEVAHGKPAPDVFIAAAERLGFDPKNCVVFEDAPVGIEAGKAAGCFVVALATTHHPTYLKNYDLLYPSARELNVDEILRAFFSKTR